MPPIPWISILKHAPVVMAAAERLFANTASNRLDQKAEAIETRLDRLESAAPESARLIQEMAQQIHALAAGQAANARRAQIAVTVAAVAIVVAVAAVAWVAAQ